MKIYLETLGCAKNQVDAEIMSRILRDHGHHAVASPDCADAVILNTCGFIDAAKEEGIARLLDLSELKQNKTVRYLLVTGCLSERYPKEIYKEFPLVDLVLGVSEYGEIADRLEDLDKGMTTKTLPAKGDTIAHLALPHESENDYYAYLKIAEGCDARCTYCAIPGIRGNQQSRPIDNILREAKMHLANGRKELIVIAQNTAAFGTDLYGEARLSTLIRALDGLDGEYRFRLLYAYAHLIGDELIETMAMAKHLVPYLDLPVQHISPAILKRMGRKERPFTILETVKRLRLALPKITLRSTVMVGFPGETDRDFAMLRIGLKQLNFERLGCFIFSPEEGTAAYNLPGRIDKETAQNRYKIIMEDQTARMVAWHQTQIGTTRRVLIEEISEDGLSFLGRSESESPDVDPLIRVYAQSPHVELGDLIPVSIVDADEDGMIGVTKYEPAK